MKPAINKEVKEEVLAKVKAGEAAASVAQKFGISVKTIYGWLRWFLASQPPGLEEGLEDSLKAESFRRAETRP